MEKKTKNAYVLELGFLNIETFLNGLLIVKEIDKKKIEYMKH